MEHMTIYHDPVPPFLQRCAKTPPMQRLRQVGMNCGCEYTSFPRFAEIGSYSRYEHSLGVALIIWHFTQDRQQAVSGLLHDIATPVFAHVVDFLRGDYLKQESTESGTAEMISASPELIKALSEYALQPGDVSDYHRYPIADNDSPRLSADRLEYTLGNSINYGFCTQTEAADMYRNLTVYPNEDGDPELCFRTESVAERFGTCALQCSRVYVSDEDRYAMQILSELLREALDRGIINSKNLYSTEPEVIAALQKDVRYSTSWHHFRALRIMHTSAAPDDKGEWRQIRAKKRLIDPLIVNAGRLSTLSSAFAENMNRFLRQSQDEWLKADI